MTYCAALFCPNNAYKNATLSFFRVPLDARRYELWLRNVWRTDLLGKPPRTLRICSSHFSEKMFMNKMRNRLVKNAFPDLKPETPLKDKFTKYNMVPSDVSCESDDSLAVQDEEEFILEFLPDIRVKGGDVPVANEEERFVMTYDTDYQSFIVEERQLENDMEVIVFGSKPESSSPETLCRICACQLTDSIPIFEGAGFQEKLVEKIHACLPIKVSVTDELPLQICSSCFGKVTTCHGLVICSAEADRKLRLLFGRGIPVTKSEETKYLDGACENLTKMLEQREGTVHSAASNPKEGCNRDKESKPRDCATDQKDNCFSKSAVNLYTEMIANENQCSVINEATEPVKQIRQYKKRSKALKDCRKYKIVVAKLVKVPKCVIYDTTLTTDVE